VYCQTTFYVCVCVFAVYLRYLRRHRKGGLFPIKISKAINMSLFIFGRQHHEGHILDIYLLPMTFSGYC
jgi:hypothetical protein